ncbi:MAG: nucleotidyl transferase AbiEii/AbiGii toxin family protein [Thermoanaerobaculia bacterium]
MNRERASGIAQSVQTRLGVKADLEDRPYDELLQLYGIERFLYRLAQSKHRDVLILKGALLLRVWLGENSRPTRDIDLLCPEDTDAARIRRILRDIVETKVVGDGLEFEVDGIEVRPLRPDSPGLGLRAKFDGYIGRSRLRFQVDIGMGDRVVPEPEEVLFNGLLDLPIAPVKAYTVYTVVAEKLEAMAYLGNATSRMKDFYDLLILPRRLPFDGGALTAAIQATFNQRGSAIPDALAVLSGEGEWREQEAMWRAFLRKGRLSERASLAEAKLAIHAFLDLPAKAVVAGQPFDKFWVPGGSWQA